MSPKKDQRRRLNILVTAGPTREPIDPVRFISNYSTGYFGYAVTKEARRRGNRVILISGPTALAKPRGVTSLLVDSCDQMQQRIKQKFGWCDCLIMTAAICDFRPRIMPQKKIKRAGKKGFNLQLRQNPDILAGLGTRKGKKVLVGVALETEGLEQNARAKLGRKNLDLIVATQIKTKSYPFGAVKLDALIVDNKHYLRKVRQVTKTQLARILFDSIEKIMLI